MLCYVRYICFVSSDPFVCCWSLSVKLIGIGSLCRECGHEEKAVLGFVA